MHQKPDTQANKLLGNLQKKKWATTVRSLLGDDFQLEDEHVASNITVEDALSHRTGMSGADNMYGPWMGQDPKAIVKALRHLGPPNEPFRTAYQYNNQMYSVIGDCLKSVTGLDVGAVLRNLLWDPLGMDATFWTLSQIPGEQRRNIARGYYWVDGSTRPTSDTMGYYVPEPYIDLAGVAPAGATISSVVDYAKWTAELLAAATRKDDDHSDQRVIPQGLFSELVTPRIFVFDPPGGEQLALLSPMMYGLGWVIHPPAAGVDHPIVGHAGGMNGFGAQIYLLPHDHFGVVTLANAALSGNVVGDLISLELIARKLGLEGLVKTNFVKKMQMKVPPNATDEADSGVAETDLVEPARLKTGQADKVLQRVVGEYQHPAWGSFRITRYAPPVQSAQILSKPWVPGTTHRERERRRSQIPCLRVSPVGKRTWKYEILLHPRLDSVLFDGNDSSSTAGIADEAEDRGTFFDLEVLGGHGHVEDDVVAGFDTGCEQPGKNDMLRAEKVWHSQSWSQYGAAFKMGPSRTTSPSSSSSENLDPFSGSLGLRLATAHIGTDGNTDEGWDKKMVWLTKLDSAS